MRADGDLDQLWDWCIRHVNVVDLMPYGGTSEHTGYPVIRRDSDVHSAVDGTGWFWNAYPVLSPYYPIPSASPEWVDAWSMQDFHGFWW